MNQQRLIHQPRKCFDASKFLFTLANANLVKTAFCCVLYMLRVTVTRPILLQQERAYTLSSLYHTLRIKIASDSFTSNAFVFVQFCRNIIFLVLNVLETQIGPNETMSQKRQAVRQ